jgi:hypothetical protein
VDIPLFSIVIASLIPTTREQYRIIIDSARFLKYTRKGGAAGEKMRKRGKVL